MQQMAVVESPYLTSCIYIGNLPVVEVYCKEAEFIELYLTGCKAWGLISMGSGCHCASCDGGSWLQ